MGAIEAYAACIAEQVLRGTRVTSRSAKRFRLLAVLAGVTAYSLSVSPAGAQSFAKQTSAVEASPEWQHGHFQNPQPTWSNIPKALLQEIFGAKVPETRPSGPVPVVASHGEALRTASLSGLRVTWFGHSSALVEVDGSRLLIDPFWGERASPVSWIGPKRWYPVPIALKDLPEIDAVLLSHDHYDHMDYGTIRAMRTWKTTFVVPLGVGAELYRWGIPRSRIVELDWWHETRLGRLTLVATPARHQSGRSVLRMRKTLWAGWAVLGDQHRVWYSGDTGYSPELAKIGERLGPFDATLIEVGQYGRYWPDFHLGPEQAVEVNRQVGGAVMIPVHWGLIRLANHAWTEPVERVLAAAQCQGVEVLVPRPGESIEPTEHPSLPAWWPKIPWKPASDDPIAATNDGDPAQRVSLSPCVP